MCFKATCSSLYATSIISLVSCGFLGIGLLSLPLLNKFVTHTIKQKIALSENSTSPFYSEWTEPTVPIYLQLYTFNVTNFNDVTKGEKPHLVQHGPYTYLESRKKHNIQFNDNGTVTYQERKVYNFVRELSIGSDDDEFYTLNFAFVVILNVLDDLPEIIRPAVHVLLNNIALFRQYKVRDIVWGYQDEILAFAKKLDPSRFYTDVAGILIGKNNTDDGLYTIHTGVDDIKKLGLIDKFNGSSFLDFWTSKQANMINGSDGTVFGPNVKRDQILNVFSSDVCRSLSGEYLKDKKNKYGINTLEFVGSKNCLANATEYPGNEGFCTPSGNCLDSGVLNVSTCLVLDGFHLPVIVSFPHFIMAAPQYKNDFEGLDNFTEDYQTVFNVEPITGLLVEAYKRMQLNLYVKANPNIRQTKHMHDLIFPVLWGNESVVLTSKYQRMIYDQMVLPLFIAHVFQVVLIGVASLAFILSSILFIYFKCRAKIIRYSVEPLNDEQPFLSNNGD